MIVSNLFWLSQEAYYRLLAQKLLPEEVDRFLWLDSDTVVLGNIEDFYHQDLEGKLLCACSFGKEGETSEKIMQFSLPKDTLYFNSGVYLADLAAQRKVIDPDIYETYLRIFEKRLRFADQDILNAVFYHCTKYAPVDIYNFIPSRLNQLTRQERKETREHCKIIHYNGGHGKPWNPEYASLWASAFWDYAEELPEYAGKYAELKPAHKKSRAKYLRKYAKAMAEKKKKEQEAEQEAKQKEENSNNEKEK